MLPSELLSAEIMNLVAAIHEYKGKQELFIEAKPDILESMLEIARIQSTGASNRIEGIHASEGRLSEIVRMKAEPKTRSEREISGYRDVLCLIHESYDYMQPRPNVLLQMHRDLYKYSPSSIGGNYKNSDNAITETDVDGNSIVRFKPLSAFETPDAMERLTSSFIDAIAAQNYDPLLLTSMFVLDFLCIHPFNDGNGRISRLLTLLLLYRSGYIVGKYISIEMFIENTKETYYETLSASSNGWQHGRNNYYPFVKYYLEIILGAYKDFDSRVIYLHNHKLSKPDRVKALFKNSLQTLSKKMILEKLPDTSISTVETALSSLLKDGYIVIIKAGKNTAYIRNTNNE
jgi:Fic family protein